MVASTDKLAGIHGRLADAMSDALDAEVRRIELTRELFEVDISELDEDTAKQVSTALSLAPTARVDNALFKTVAAFLKDNNISSDMDDGDDVNEQKEKLERLQKKRTVAQTPVDMMN